MAYITHVGVHTLLPYVAATSPNLTAYMSCSIAYRCERAAGLSVMKAPVKDEAKASALFQTYITMRSGAGTPMKFPSH